MIFDRLNNASNYGFLDEKFALAFDFLTKNDLKNLKDGKYEIKGDEVFANVQSLKTKPKNEKKWEVHKNYIDIQYLIQGQEAMGYGILEDFCESTPYDEEKDVAFLNTTKNFNYVNLEAGDFVIFCPTDVHAPMLSVDKEEQIKKVIVKIKI